MYVNMHWGCMFNMCLLIETRMKMVKIVVLKPSGTDRDS